MIESNFVEISNEFNCDYTVENFNVSGMELGAVMPVSIYRLNPVYKKVTINISCDLGHQNLAQFNFEMTSNPFPKFEINIKSHFIRFITFSKKTWRVSSQNKRTSKELTKMLDVSGLTKIAEKEAFEPVIIGEMKGEKLSLDTKFYLGFNNKEEAIRPVIQFHQLLIDFVKENYCR